MTLSRMSLGSSEKTPTEELVMMLLNGSILERLDQDFVEIRVQDVDEYLLYIEEHWTTFACNTFALYRGYRFDIVATGVLSTESLQNRAYPYLRLNDDLGFRLVNTKVGKVVSVSSYEDIVRQLRA